MEIGVRELKQRLSEMLERAAAGETIRVTDRGRPKAILGPLPETSGLEAGIDAGWITPPRVQTPAARVARVSATQTTEQSLIDDRGR